MTKSRKLLFLLSDGGRARLVRRSPYGHYVTFEEIDGTARLETLRRELRASPPARSFSSMSRHRSAVGREDYFRPAKEAFVAEISERAAELCAEEDFDSVVVAAPPRLIGPLKRKLEARVPVAAAVPKDLAKTPDEELGPWFDDMLAPPPSES